MPKNEQFFELIFIDPPYEEDYVSIVKSLILQGWIKEKSVIVIEFKSGKDLGEIGDLLKHLETRIYGGTSFGFFVRISGNIYQT